MNSDNFVKNGYFVKKKLFNQKEVNKYINEIHEIFKISRERLANERQKKTYVLPDGVTKYEKFWPIIYNKSLLSIIRSLIGKNIKYTQHSDIHINLGAGQFHRDNAYRTFKTGPDWNEKKHEYKVVRVAIYLSDSKNYNSSLKILPNTHKNQTSLNTVELTIWRKLRNFWRKFFDNNFLPNFFFTTKMLSIQHDAGDCVIFDQRLVHAGGSIYNSNPKYAIFLSFGFDNQHSHNHHKFYLSRPTYLKEMPKKLKIILEKKKLLLKNSFNSLKR